jgi:hypothetical protein
MYNQTYRALDNDEPSGVTFRECMQVSIPLPSHFLLLLSHSEKKLIPYKKMRRLLLSTYLFAVILVACLFHVSESIGNAESPEAGYLIEYEDGTFEFIPHGQTASQFTTNDEEAEVQMAITSIDSGETSFLSRATYNDLQRKKKSFDLKSKCGFVLSESRNEDSKRRGPCRQRRLLRGPKGR